MRDQLFTVRRRGSHPIAHARTGVALTTASGGLRLSVSGPRTAADQPRDGWSALHGRISQALTGSRRIRQARSVFLLLCLLLSAPLLFAQETASPEPPRKRLRPSPPKNLKRRHPSSAWTPPEPLTWAIVGTWGCGAARISIAALVNLGEGPRLLGANLTMNSPLGAGKYIDRLQLNASAWGGDPYNTLRLFAEKSGVYQFSFDYRKVDYFNFIPTFANPLLAQGIFLGQHSFDSTRRTMDFDLTLRPGATISPFIAYSRNSGFGPGVTTFTADGNEFAVTNQLRDTSDYYRGGVHFNLVAHESDARTRLPDIQRRSADFPDQWYQSRQPNHARFGTIRGFGTAGRKLPFPGNDAGQPRSVDRHTVGQADGGRPVCV